MKEELAWLSVGVGGGGVQQWQSVWLRALSFSMTVYLCDIILQCPLDVDIYT